MGIYIDETKFDIEKIASELFDFSKLGAVFVPNALTNVAKEDLLEAIIASRKLFKTVQRDVGEVTQEMETFYLESLSEEPPRILRSRLALLEYEYSFIYQQIAELACFDRPIFNSVGIHYYPIGSAGISSHQDYVADTNLVASFVIKGNAPFFVCKNRKKDESVELNSTPGTVIFMRAARNSSEQAARPYHYLVGPIEEDRYSIIVRNRQSPR